MEFLETVQSIAEEVYLFEAGYERELPRDVWPDDMRDVREVPLEDLLRRPVLVCGSLYLLGPFRRWLEAELNL